jgi:hypothetical protein
MMTGGYAPIPTDDGWPVFLLIVAVAALLLLAEWNDRRRGRYPRDWKD